MTAVDDGHGPSYGCNYQKCGNPSADLPCPFTKAAVMKQHAFSVPTSIPPPQLHADKCRHEWRQYFADDIYEHLGSYFPILRASGFYCIHCLEVAEK